MPSPSQRRETSAFPECAVLLILGLLLSKLINSEQVRAPGIARCLISAKRNKDAGALGTRSHPIQIAPEERGKEILVGIANSKNLSIISLNLQQHLSLLKTPNA